MFMKTGRASKRRNDSFDDLMAEQTEIIAGKQKEIRRLKVENEQLRDDLASTNQECAKQSYKLQALQCKLDREVTKSATLQSRVNEQEEVDANTVSMELYQEMYCKLISWKSTMDELRRENSELKTSVSSLESKVEDMMVEAVRKEEERKETEFSLRTSVADTELQNERMTQEMKWLKADNTMIRDSWKQDADSMIHRMNQLESAQDEGLALLQIKAEAELRTEWDMLGVLSSESVTSERQKRSRFKFWKRRRRNKQVMLWQQRGTEARLLAKGFVEIITEKETQIGHLNALKKMLWDKMTELERAKKSLESDMEMFSHSDFCSEPLRYSGSTSPMAAKVGVATV